MAKKQQELTEDEKLAFSIVDLTEAMLIDLMGLRVVERTHRRIKPEKRHVKTLLDLIRRLLDYVERRVEEEEVTLEQVSILLKTLDFLAAVLTKDRLFYSIYKRRRNEGSRERADTEGDEEPLRSEE